MKFGFNGGSEKMAEELVNLLADLKEKESLNNAQARLNAGDDPLEILKDAQRGMGIVGKRFTMGEYFIPDLIYSGEILKQLSAMVKPHIGSGAVQTQKLGKIVLGTVAGDIHDIGKDIVGFMLDINGFEVHDLGIDVPPENFVEKVNETGASIVALSGFLTLAYDSMKKTIEALAAAGLRDKVKVMIGGGQITEEVQKYTGADAYGKDAMVGVSLAKRWSGAN
jgi:methanogenic corrinoid protein MtbC1